MAAGDRGCMGMDIELWFSGYRINKMNMCEYGICKIFMR